MSRLEMLAKLSRFGISPTPQRLEIATLVLRKPQHLSADQIVRQLRSAGSKISKATVYNSLKVFAKSGLIKEYRVDSLHRVYDSRTQPHHHFFNADSGELIDIPADDIEILGLPEPPAGTCCAGVELVVRIRDSAE